MSLTSRETAPEKVQDFVVAIGPENARCIRNFCLMLPGIMPLLHLRLALTIDAWSGGHSPLAVLTSFLAETQANFHGAPAIVLSYKTIALFLLTPEGRLSRFLGHSFL